MKSKWIHIKIGEFRHKLFCDTGSKKTIITPLMYHPSMGQIVVSDCHLRVWGSEKRLDVKGMFQTDLKSTGGGCKRTWLYVVDGDRLEPLLGEADAEDLGIILFNPEGKNTSQICTIRSGGEKQGGAPDASKEAAQKAGIKVETSCPPTDIKIVSLCI